MENQVDKKILKAALEVVSTEKISGTRMHIIAKEANMSQANLHYHFTSKEELMTSLLNSIQEEFSKGRSKYIDIERKTVSENVKGFFDQKKDDILINKKIEYAQMDFWVQGTVNENIRDILQNTFNIWRSNIEDILPKKEGIDEKNLKNLPFLMVSLMMGSTLQYLIDEEKFNLDDYFQVAEKMILSQYEGKNHEDL